MKPTVQIQQPFFARFLENQQHETKLNNGPTFTLKFPSDAEDDVVTLKFPSDGDEV
jgi:hypothetical protein